MPAAAAAAAPAGGAAPSRAEVGDGESAEVGDSGGRANGALESVGPGLESRDAVGDAIAATLGSSDGNASMLAGALDGDAPSERLAVGVPDCVGVIVIVCELVCV